MSTNNHRFTQILDLTPSCKPLYNRALAELEDMVVVPTLGSIVPNWLLFVPTWPSLNYRNWNTNTGRDPLLSMELFCEQFGHDFEKAIWFEHGAASSGSPIGCGVDYAHLHLLIDSQIDFSEFANAAHSLSGVEWRPLANQPSPYDDLPFEEDYYVFGQGRSAFVGNNNRSLGSQFFRRVVARLVKRDAEWDYKSYPFSANIAATCNNFGKAIKDAA
ncbi:hypothetical protein [Aestuariivirga sp.]|uniref:hypothetical protein n=1 Tax=Aestuariivirga sp. TaxID=2650926 RepID=UPI0039E472EA